MSQRVPWRGRLFRGENRMLPAEAISEAEMTIADSAA
jgi:hypothetical protein